MSRNARGVQTALLVVFGAGILLLGGNIALGGVETLGLQFPPAGLSAVDGPGFQRHDNNVRFLGGVFAGAGLLILLAARWTQLRPTAAALLALLPLGGLARLLQPDYTVLADPAFYGSLLSEFIAAPLLAAWVWRSARPAHRSHDPR